jgi:DNA-binding beta-propeller fold protein YncE
VYKLLGAVGLLVSLCGVTGCGSPRGVLFPAIEPPRFWPAPPDTPRIRFVGELTDSRDLKAARSGMEVVKAAFRGPRPPIRFSSPHGVAISVTGQVAVADSGGRAIHVVDTQQRTHRLITGFAEERFGSPVGVAWVGERLFVTDASRHEVIELSAMGVLCQRFGSDRLTWPIGITYVKQRNQLYVVDGRSHRLAVFNPEGGFLRTIGTRGTAKGAFNFPTHIACAQDRLLVADSGNFRVQLLDLDGNVIRTIGQKGDGAGDLSLPKGVAFDSEGHIYVADAHFENIQVFNGEGRLLMALGQEGHEPGRFSLPAGLAISGDDRIWVADSGNRRLQVFEYMRTSS